MSLLKLRDLINKLSEELWNQKPTIIGVKTNEDTWTVEIEIVVHDEYMRKIAKKALIETYEVEVSKEFCIDSFKRVRMRERGTIEELIEEE